MWLLIAHLVVGIFKCGLMLLRRHPTSSRIRLPCFLRYLVAVGGLKFSQGMEYTGETWVVAPGISSISWAELEVDRMDAVLKLLA